MIYGVNDRPPLGKMILFSLQVMLSCFTATALIGQICGVPLSGAFLGALLGISTAEYRKRSDTNEQ